MENQDKISSNQNKHQTKNPLRKLLLNNFHAVLKSLIVENTNLRSVLEIGCGEGFVLEYLTNHMEIPTIIGTDISDEAVEKAKNRLPQAYFKTADLSSGNFAEALSQFEQPQFDLCLCLEVLEHILDYNKALENLKNIPAETFIISVPNEPFFKLSNLVALKNVKTLGNDPEHVNNWTSQQFKTLLEQHFTVISCHYPFPWQMYLCKKKN